MNQEKKNKHMTLDDRIEIQECLSKGMTFSFCFVLNQEQRFFCPRT